MCRCVGYRLPVGNNRNRRQNRKLRFSGKNPGIPDKVERSVLLCEITKVGILRLFITLAIVKVLPLPVTPNSTCEESPFFIPCTKLFMASGWSPVGLNDDLS